MTSNFHLASVLCEVLSSTFFHEEKATRKYKHLHLYYGNLAVQAKFPGSTVLERRKFLLHYDYDE